MSVLRTLAVVALCGTTLGAQPEQHTLVLRAEPAKEVLTMATYSRAEMKEDARCAVKWHYGADGDSVIVDSLSPARIAARDSMHVYGSNGRELCPGSQPLFHTHLLWMLTLDHGGYIAPRTPSGCDALIAIRGDHPWDVIVDVTPISFVPFVYVTTDTVKEHYRCP